MNKAAIKNFAVWARNKLIAEISYRAGLMGITAEGIREALPQSTGTTEFYDIGTAEPYSVSGVEVRQRRQLAELIRRKEKETNYKTAYKYVIEEVTYTWFNRLIAVRFMEINDYLPSHIRVLSSDSGKTEPDLVTNPFGAGLSFTQAERQEIIRLKQENKTDEVFRLLFIKQCNALNEILPALFEKTSDYTELLLNLSVVDQDGVLWHLVHDIPEADFDVERGGQVEIIGWLYQYYNTEPKNEAFAKKGKISKEEVPAVTQLFTPDWIVRYMVENSLGRLWIEHLRALDESADEAALAASFGWKYYLPEAKQEPEVETELTELRKERASLTPEQITAIDPCMGSGHILVYAFDVLMQIYESAGYGQRDAAGSILEHNLYGLDIDDRAFQLAYFAVMMKARQYNRRILNGEHKPNVYSIQESNGIDRNQLKFFGEGLSETEKKRAIEQMTGLLDTFKDAKEYGSILTVDSYDWELLNRFVSKGEMLGQMSMDTVGLDETREDIQHILELGKCLSQKYHTVTTNPPYMDGGNMNSKLGEYVKKQYEAGKNDLFSVFIFRCRNMCIKSGIVSMITQHGWMFLGSYAKLRMDITNSMTLINMAHLGARAFDEIGGEVVQTTTFALRKDHMENYSGAYVRLVNGKSEIEKRDSYLDKIKRGEKFTFTFSKVEKIPNYFIGYWLDSALIDHLIQTKKTKDYGVAKQGLITSDNERFLRLWYEVLPEKMNLKWFPYNKGGGFRRWFGNVVYVVNWENDGFEICHFYDDNRKLKSRPQNIQFFFREALTWNDVSTADFCCRLVEKGTAFDASGPEFFLFNEENLLYFLGLFNSTTIQEFMSLICQGLHYSTGHIPQIPVVIESKQEVEDLVRRNVEIVRNDWDSFEISSGFKKHPLI